VQQFAEPDDAVDGGANLVADDGEELAFGAVGGLGGFFGGEKGAFGFLARGDVVTHGLVFYDGAGGILDGTMGPGMHHAGVVRMAPFMFEGCGFRQGIFGGKKAFRAERAGLAQQFLASATEETRVGAVYEGEPPIGGIAADEVGLILHYGAIAGLQFLE